MKNQQKEKPEDMLVNEEGIGGKGGLGSEEVLAIEEVNLVKVEFAEEGNEGGNSEGENNPLNLSSDP